MTTELHTDSNSARWNELAETHVAEQAKTEARDTEYRWSAAITRACGHSDTVNLFAPDWYDSSVKYIKTAESRFCSPCFAKQQQDLLGAVASKLYGSPKQVAWADKIRSFFLSAEVSDEEKRIRYDFLTAERGDISISLFPPKVTNVVTYAGGAWIGALSSLTDRKIDRVSKVRIAREWMAHTILDAVTEWKQIEASTDDQDLACHIKEMCAELMVKRAVIQNALDEEFESMSSEVGCQQALLHR